MKSKETEGNQVLGKSDVLVDAGTREQDDLQDLDSLLSLLLVGLQGVISLPAIWFLH